MASPTRPTFPVSPTTPDAAAGVLALTGPVPGLPRRGILLPSAPIHRAAARLAPLCSLPVVVPVLVGWLVLDVVLLRTGSLVAATDELLATPVLLVPLYVLLVLGSLLHAVGHAAACRYGGEQPGQIYASIRLGFPTFHADVTDSWRLGRAGLVRTDLGGLYFTVLGLLLTATGYLATGGGLLLLAVLALHAQVLVQLVPDARFDGYFVLSHVAGVPDPTARVGPALAGLLPGRPVDPRAAEIGPGARHLVVAWVVLLVPLQALALGWLLWNLPAIAVRIAEACWAQVEQLVRAAEAGELVPFVIGLVSLVLLALLCLWLAALLWRVLTQLGEWSLLRLLSLTSEAPAAVAPLTPHPAPIQEVPMTTLEGPNGLTAESLTDESVLPVRRPRPTMGWQRRVYDLTRHSVSPRPGQAERRRLERDERLRAPITGTRRVVVMSRKGGVGKTTITLALGSILATVRGDRVVAVDANPDAGNLAHRVAPFNGRTITDVLGRLDEIGSYAELRTYTAQAQESRLEVLASDNDPRIGMALDRDDYHRLIGLLDLHYNVILLDTGTGILDSANQGLLSEADELVLVLRPGLDGGRAAALTLDWMDEHDYGALVRRAVVVINAVRDGVGAPIDPIREHFEERCAGVLVVPWDPALETGAQTALSELGRRTREGLIDLAAAVADNFAGSGYRR